MDKNSARNGSAFQLAVVCYHSVLAKHTKLRQDYAKRSDENYRVAPSVAQFLQQRRNDSVNLRILSAETQVDATGARHIGNVTSFSAPHVVHGVMLFPRESRSTCTCRTPSIRGLPCRHAVKVAITLKIEVESLVHRSFTTEAGRIAFGSPAQTVPVATADLEPCKTPIIAPVNHPKRGRPSTKRKRGKNEPTSKKAPRSMRCSVCKQVGHTKRSCAQ